ncbi:MAG TPA: tripartite tricarboxylate transporter substrate binding protein [Burkholderiales bacterium]|jgi:tripartite-type tricarboxylate transporter receptor subunit TctC
MRRAAFLLLLAACGTAGAQSYPAKPITLVAPSTPGSAPDVLARVLAARLSEQLGSQMVVLNRPGAGTNIGTQAVAQAAPDGYTVLLGSIANTLNPHIMGSVGYRLEDFAPVSSVAAAPDVLVVHPSVPATSVAELIALLKSKPGTPAGHAGIGTTPHLSLEIFRRMAGVDITPVPFKGGGEAQQGILGGQVPFMFSTTIGILPRVRSGQLRALAVSSAKRIAAAPELPTVAESGLAGFDVVAWFGLFAPAGTPRPIVERLSSETRAALSAPEVRKRLIDLGAEPLGSSPDEFSAYVSSEFARWGRLAKEAGIRID